VAVRHHRSAWDADDFVDRDRGVFFIANINRVDMKYIVLVIGASIVFGIGVLIGKQLGIDEIKAKNPNLYNFQDGTDHLKLGDYWITYPNGKPGIEYSISVYEKGGWNRILYRNAKGELFIHHQIK
jgi:hypothetical protein